MMKLAALQCIESAELVVGQRLCERYASDVFILCQNRHFNVQLNTLYRPNTQQSLACVAPTLGALFAATPQSSSWCRRRLIALD